MIFLDANIFLRVLGGGNDAHVQQAAGLLRQIQRGAVQATTSEVVIHEVCYVLNSRSQYGRSVGEIVDAMTAILLWPGLRFGGNDKDLYVRALNLWSQHPKLGFADAVIAARCERSGHELATFDRHFRDLPFLNVWQPETPVPDGP